MSKGGVDNQILPTIAIVAHYDSIAVAPVKKKKISPKRRRIHSLKYLMFMKQEYHFLIHKKKNIKKIKNKKIKK